MKTLTSTMQAAIIEKFGEADVLRLKNLPIPKPKDKELLVKVYATSVNPVDYKIRKGMFGDLIKLPVILGFDVSGVVEAVGDKVKSFKKGDEVFYLPRIIGWQGSYAEYHLVEEEIVAEKPSKLSHLEAAAIPLVGSTAWDALVERCKIKSGETILIHAGAGGVGSFAIQLAKAYDLKVFTTCGKYNVNFVKNLGADEVIDYRTENFKEVILKKTGGIGVDVVFDTVGSEIFTQSLNVLKPYGRITSIVRSTANYDLAFTKNIDIYPVFVQSARYKLDVIKRLIEEKKIRPVVDSVMPLKEVVRAHEKLEKGGVKGKIVLQVVG